MGSTSRPSRRASWIAGPNGAGKSTLIKILAAEARADDGTILLDGEPWSPDLQQDRVAVVHQEPQLFPNLTVGENLMVGREDTRARRRGLRPPRSATCSRTWPSSMSPTSQLERVPLAVQQRTEIGTRPRADGADRALRRAELRADRRGVRGPLPADASARGRGHVVILVSHRLAELVRHADRVAVILDGVCTRVVEPPDLTQETIAAGARRQPAEREPQEQLVVRLGR